MVKYHNKPNGRGYIISKWSAKKWLVKTQKRRLPNLMVTSISALISTRYNSVFKNFIPALSLPLVVLCETLFQLKTFSQIASFYQVKYNLPMSIDILKPSINP